jgi:hypothetical protein
LHIFVSRQGLSHFQVMPDPRERLCSSLSNLNFAVSISVEFDSDAVCKTLSTAGMSLACVVFAACG